jgi:hypothetical protein
MTSSLVELAKRCGCTWRIVSRRQRSEGAYAQQLAQLFDVNARKLGLDRPMPAPSSAAFRPPARDGQVRLI